MRLPSVRFTIGQLMVAVALIAVFLAWLGVWAAIALVGLGLVIIPTAVTSPGHPLESASWASSLQPAVVLFYLYATWATAWCVLGHRPRPSLDDPKFISPIVDVPYDMFAFSFTLGWMICVCTGLLLSAVPPVEGTSALSWSFPSRGWRVISPWFGTRSVLGAGTSTEPLPLTHLPRPPTTRRWRLEPSTPPVPSAQTPPHTEPVRR
jgi:hypothetical protein